MHSLHCYCIKCTCSAENIEEAAMSTYPTTSLTSEPGTRGAAVRFPFPPALFAVPLVAALLADRAWPLPLRTGPVGTGVGVALTLGGVAFSLSGAATVLRHRTTVVPHRPVAALVTSGPFRVSRNPMYAGHAVTLVGAALWAGSWWPLLAAALAVAVTQRLVIRPEEAYLSGRFGDAYARYRSRVRRWL
jgi:protein-S-isoprenylcysteine O-methyltransferase Ste14